MRSGAEYTASLRDGRTVIIDGERVDDVTTHPAFIPSVQTTAELFDLAADPANGMQYVAPETGNVANRTFSIARSAEELRLRREAIQTWARHTHGWMGRSPDHVASFFAAYAANAHLFGDAESNGGHDFAENVRAWYRRVLDENLYLSYAIIPPQVSRATTASGWGEEFLQVGVVRETEDGIVVRGSQMLATNAAIVDGILISCVKPLGPDDRNFAISFVVPAAAKGLKLYCRRPYAPAVPSAFDYPLTSRYDEPDALVVFDDVLVPWDAVLVNRDPEGLRRQFFETGAHALGNWQAQIRLVEKLKFIAGVARRVTQVNGVDKIPSVQGRLGDVAAIVAGVESAMLAAEYTAEPDAVGQWLPGKRALYGAMGLQHETYPRVIEIVRDLVGGGVLQLPSSVKDLTNPDTRADIERYIQSPGVASEERIKLFRLAWDIIGSEFGGRHQQYEMFYAGAPFVVAGYAYRNFDYEKVLVDVEKFLSSYHLEVR